MRTFVFSGMALIAATYGLARFGYGLFLPRFTETFEMSSVVSGSIQAGSFLSFCIAAVIAARLGARPRLVVTCAGATAGLGAVGVAVSPHVLVFAVSVMIAGAGAGFATPGLVALAESNVPAQRRGGAQTVVNAGTGAGIVVAGLLMFLTLGQWRLGWWIIAAVVAAVTLAVLRTDQSSRQHPRQQQGPPPQTHTRSGGLLSALRWPITAALLGGASSAAIWTFGRSIMAEPGVGGETYSILAWMVLGAFGILGALAGKITRAASVAVAWNLTTVAMALSTIALGLAPGVLVSAYLAVAIFGAGYTAICGVLIIWAGRMVPDQAAAGTAVLFIALAVGQAIGSVVLGVLLSLGSEALAFGVAGVLGVLAVAPTMARAATGSPERAALSG